MRKCLDSKSLKRSSLQKNQKIHNQIKTFIQAGNTVADMTAEALWEIQEKFPSLIFREIAGGGLIIKSNGDVWSLENEGRYVVTYHRGWGKKFGKYCEQWHLQGVFQDFYFACAMIISHDAYKITGRGYSFSKIYELAYES